MGSNNKSTLMQQRVDQVLHEKDVEIATLRQRVESLSHQLQRSLQQNSSNHNNGGSTVSSTSSSTTTATTTTTTQTDGKRRNFISMSLDAVNVREISSGTGKKIVSSSKQRIGRTASIATRNVLDMLSVEQQLKEARDRDSQSLPPVIQRVLAMFENPTYHMDYLNSQLFAKDLIKLCRAVRHLLDRNEPRVVYIQSPVYVFGDIHGNLEDLHFFSDNIWRLGMSLTAGNFLFLGDYVDRGLSCLETVSYLLAMKQQLPTKVYLLRGNHETRDVNGWEEHYGERSFIWQCRNRFGDDIGYRVWEACNSVFDRLPLAAVIDQDIFCVHGGIPRPISATTTRIQDILTVPKVAGINPPYEHEDDQYQQVASDCIWSDPASEEQEMTTVDPETGFGESLRGGGAICFGAKAVTDFLHQQDFSYIMRAHEAHADGVAVSKGARVFTVFSTSQDHNQGSHAMAGCILVDNDKLQVINRSPAYKNQYIHRRDSVSLLALSDQELQQRIKLGLVTNAPQSQYHQQQYYHQADDDDDEVVGDAPVASGRGDFERWEDLQDSDDDEGDANNIVNNDDAELNNNEISEDPNLPKQNNLIRRTRSNSKSLLVDDGDKEEFVFDTKRRSSVDLESLSENIHDLISAASDWDGNNSYDLDHVGDHGSSLYSHQQTQAAKRRRSKKPLVESISEISENIHEEDDDVDAEIETVNADDIPTNITTTTSNDNGPEDMEVRVTDN